MKNKEKNIIINNGMYPMKYEDAIRVYLTY